MNKIFSIILFLLSILGFASGLAKVMLVQHEVEFLSDAGFGINMIVFYGMAQIAGAALLLLKRTRATGAVLLGLTFAISTVLIFRTDQLLFGAISVVPVAICLLILWRTRAKA